MRFSRTQCFLLHITRQKWRFINFMDDHLAPVSCDFPMSWHHDLWRTISKTMFACIRSWNNVVKYETRCKNKLTRPLLCIIVCALFQARCRNKTSYALINHCISKCLGGHQSRTLKSQGSNHWLIFTVCFENVLVVTCAAAFRFWECSFMFKAVSDTDGLNRFLNC